MKDYTAANNYYALIDTMSELFAKANTLRIDAYYLSYDRYKSYKVAALLSQADELESSAYDYMYQLDLIHSNWYRHSYIQSRV